MRYLLVAMSVIGFAIGGIIAPPSASAVWTWLVPASSCYPYNGAATSWLVNNSGNMFHASTGTNQRIACGLPTDSSTPQTTRQVTVYYYDGNNSSSSGDQYNVYCEGYSYPETAQTWWFTTTRVWGCSSTYGCPGTPTVPYSGSGAIRLNGFYYNYGNPYAFVMNVECSAPRYGGSPGTASEIISFRVNDP
jgi:hypothetical protein